MSQFIVKQMRAAADGEKLYAKIGRYLGSPVVRKSCGGYPINDGPDYVWLVALEKRGLTACGFLNFEITKQGAVLHNGYVDPAYRGTGVFREMLRQALANIDHDHLSASATVSGESAEALSRVGFTESSKRGAWIRMERKAK